MTTQTGAGVSTQARTVVRTAFLGRFISEFVHDVTGMSIERTIARGVVLKQIIKGIGILVMKGNQAIGRVMLEIDWDKHRVLLHDPQHSHVVLEVDMSTIEQVSKAVVELVRYLRDYIAKTGAEPQIYFWYRPGVDSAQQNEFMRSERLEVPEFMGEGKTIPIGEAEAFRSSMDAHGLPAGSPIHRFQARPEKLPEVSIHGELVPSEFVERVLQGDLEMPEDTDEAGVSTIIDQVSGAQFDETKIISSLYHVAREIVKDITGIDVEEGELRENPIVVLKYHPASDEDSWQDILIVERRFFRLRLLQDGQDEEVVNPLGQRGGKMAGIVADFVGAALKRKREHQARVEVAFFDETEFEIAPWSGR